MAQIKDTIDCKKYKRLFTFGCSMTNYFWPTWADLLGKSIGVHYNYARSGAGNQYIACAITEANLKYNFNQDDLIIVMWTSVSREDRYRNGQWQVGGNVYTSDMMGDEYIEKWADTRYYLLRDLNYVTLTQAFLNNLNVDYDMLAMSSFVELQLKGRDETFRNGTDILDMYSKTLEKIKPDILSTQFNGTWPQVPIKNKSNNSTHDYHPTPLDHLSYLKKVYTDWSAPSNVIELAETYNRLIEESEYITDIDWKESRLWRI